MDKFSPTHLYRLGTSRPYLVLIAAILLTVLSVYFARNLKIETDFSKLLPKNTPSVKNLNDFKNTFGSLGFLYLTVEDENMKRAESFADIFVKQIENLPAVRYIHYRRPVEFFKQRRWFFVDLDDIREMERRVDQALVLEKVGVSPVFSDLMDFADREDRPDLTFEDIKLKYEKQFKSQDDPLEKGKDENFIIIRVKSFKGSEDFEENRALVDEIKDIERRLLEKPEFHGVQVGYSGHYMTSLETVDLIRREFSIVSAVVGFLLILILFGYFKRLSGSLLVGIPLLMGIIWTSGLIYFILGHVNILTTFGFSILAGLGSDYGIYLLARFFREMDSGSSFQDACYRTFSLTGKGVSMAALTTIAAFGSLFFSEFDVFFELGLVGFLGLILNYLAMMTVLPALVTVAHLHPHGDLINRLLGWRHKKNFLPWENSPRIEKIFSPTGARAAILCFILIALAAAFTVPEESQIVYDESQTEYRNLPSARLHHRILKSLGASLNPTAVMIRGTEHERKLVRGLEQMLDKSDPKDLVFEKVLGLSTMVPPDQEEKANILRRILPKYQKAKYVNEGQKRKFFKSVNESLDAGVFGLQDLPNEFERSFVGLSDPNAYLVFLFASFDRNTKEGIRRFNDGVVKSIENLGLKGMPVENSFVFSDILEILEREAGRGFLFIMLFMLGFLFLTIRNAKRTLLIFANLLGSLLILSGVLYFSGLRLNILNICVIPILLGTGIDCFIHFSHHFDESGNLMETIKSDIPPIMTANLTSIVGFGGLLFTSGLGLRSIGWIAVIGLIIITLIGVFIFPRCLSIPFLAGKWGVTKTPSPHPAGTKN